MNMLFYSSTEYTIGMDVGGTKIATGLVSREGEIVYEIRRPTKEDPDQIINDMATSIREVWEATGHRDIPIGVGVPGLVTHEGVLRYGPNISIVNMNIKAKLQAEFPNVPIHIDNDANVATWAEFCIGASKQAKARNVVMFTLGTGIGGGIIVNGVLLRGANGFAGELGHVIIDKDGKAGPSQIPGEIEAYASGTAIGVMAKQRYQNGQLGNSVLASLQLENITGASVSQAAIDGDQAAIDILKEIGHALGIASAGCINVFDPDLVIIGGGAARASHVIIQAVQETQNQYTLGAPTYRDYVPVVHAHFSEQAGIVGAALLAFKTCGTNYFL